MEAIRDSLTFIGREAELERLASLLSDTLAGRGRVCFVTGEPGSGKSSLLAEFRSRSERQYPQLTFLDGDCNPQTGEADPYLPFREILGDALDGLPRDERTGSRRSGSREWLAQAGRLISDYGPDLIDIFVPGAALVSRVGGQAAQSLRKRKGPGGSASGGDEPGGARILEQYTNVIHAFAERGPLVLVLDDLHWADAASVNLLFHLARRMADHPVLLLGAYRENELHHAQPGQRHPLGSVVNELRRMGGEVVIDLEQARERQGREFVDRLLDAEPNQLDERFRLALFHHTGGQPLFTVELVMHLKAQGQLRQDADGQWRAEEGITWSVLPARVEGVIAERTDRLEARQRDCLQAASVLGESFSAELLAEMLGTDSRQLIRLLSGPLTREHRLVAALGIERQGSRRSTRYAFRHNLIQCYFYASLDPVERGLLHEDAAAAIEGLHGSEDRGQAVALARHFREAGIDDRAAEQHFRAGQVARQAHAHEEALEHFRQALQLLDRERQAELHFDLQEETAGIETLQGGFGRARERCRTVLAECPADATLRRVRLLRRVSTTLEREHRHGEALAVLDEAERTLEADLTVAEDFADRERVELVNARLWLHYWQGDVPAMESVISASEQLLERCGSGTQRRRFYTGKAAYLNRLDRFLPGAETLSASREALRSSLSLESLADRADGLFGHAFMLLLSDDPERAVEPLDRCLGFAERLGDRTLLARCRTYRAVLALRLGQADGLRGEIEAAEPLCHDLGMREYTAVLAGCRAWLGLERGRPAEVRRQSDTALETWREHAPGYPLKWIALFPRLALEQEEGDPFLLATLVGQLLAPGNARFPDALAQSLQDAARALDEQDADFARQAVAEAVGFARTHAYL